MLLAIVPQTAHGRLCRPMGSTPDTVQLLVHGGTYNGQYWDLPLSAGKYSYQRDMAARGHATFAVDLPGTGASSQPLSALITGTGMASVVHQIIGKLRNGQVLGTAFPQVVLVGHSMGSGIVVLEAATYRDVDGVILTGMTHSMDLVQLAAIFVDGVRPALLDPVLAGRGSDPGYVTTMPGTRQVFHQPGAFEPGVLSADEATKDQVPATVVPDLVALAFTGPLSRGINVPVLLANGDRDTLFCAFHCSTESTLLTAEAPYFSPAAQLDVFLLPGAGHSLALALAAPTYRSAVDEWLHTHFAE
ncbi:alpha/beta hydrolase [Lentzea tibetensis]|uniref:Alpha/beta hydrolase n=1 Tax=Lentzea tibetensis TaxID=2591470 RepID=A0A563F0S4_9PSEU|nr:alpha/beta fold hydrolase [Lentzea tibetensis]TWP53392.1 alpha/beta hydrolase [Lentzea tibetensis]